jgi:serine/threonine protein kinase
VLYTPAHVGAFPEQKPVKFGRYILLDRINVGGMAEVFRGKMQGVEGFERLVALKRILPSISSDPDFIDMFVDEAKLAVQLQHANIAQIFELGKVDETYFIAMEYVSGVDLRTMWDRARNRNRLLPIAMSCYIMQRCCEGLDAAHRKKDETGKELGLVHRDVSPQNVLISYEGEVKVIDFGIAKSRSKVSKTQAGILKGKFGYMSPEQVRGVDLDNRSDIFACGAVLYELVVGDRLFLGESDFSTLEKVRNVEMVPPTRLNKNLSPHLERIILKALAKNREDRYRWASEMAEDLQRYLFSSNQPFARTDMQRYLNQHFKEELEKEKERLDRYRTISFAQFEEDARGSAPKRSPTRTQATEVSGGLAEVRRQLSEGSGPKVTPADGNRPDHRVPTGLQAKPIAFDEALVDEAGGRGAAIHPTPLPVHPTTSGNSYGGISISQIEGRPKLPSWVAAVIGALVAVIVVAIGAVAWMLIPHKATPGSIALEVTPAQAEIYLNDKLYSNSSPYTFDNLAPGTYVLTVKKEGFMPLIRAVTIAEGEARMESVMLESKKGTASMIVRSKPDGLAVWIDGKDSGRSTPATLTDLVAGEHQILLRKGEVTVHRERVSLNDGAADLREIDLSKLPTIFDVISEPTGAKVTINGEAKGTTPATIPWLRPGPVKVAVEREGCSKFETTASPERPSIITIDAKLRCIN